jgi:hypothetical protein
MKKCPYCGKQYPDEATVCALDGESLGGVDMDRSKVTGVWRGVYGYGKRMNRSGLEPVPFTLKLKQGWFSQFTGSVTEDAPLGMPGTGSITGFFGSSRIEFTKQMPVSYLHDESGRRLTVREYLITKGHPCERDLPSPPIFYQGTLLDTNRVQGTWLINAHRIPLPDKQFLPMSGGAGFWCAEFITADVQASPAGGPKEPLFNKTLLSDKEVEDVEGIELRSLGKFNVADAEALLDRFGREDIRFQLKRDDSAMTEMMPFTAVTGGYGGTAELVEILVHPDDEAAARQIIHRDDHV